MSDELYKVQEQRAAHNLEDEYLKQFAVRFQSRAILTDDDRAILGFIAKTVGIIEGARIIEQYFKMDDPWFLDNAYSLPVLKKNINKVKASMANTKKAVPSGDRGLKMLIKKSCDKCFQYFTWVGYGPDLEKLRLCEKCK